MKERKSYKRVIIATIALVVLLILFLNYPISLKPDSDLRAIQKRGYLTLVTAFNPTGYFIYKNTPMGFEYDLVDAFAKSLNLELKVIEASHPDEMYQKLLTGEADIMAYNIPVTNMHMEYATFSDSYITTELVLIQRKSMPGSPTHIDKVSDLAGKTITVSEKSPFLKTLYDIQFDLNNSMRIHTMDTLKTPEDLISMVANSEIEYTIANQEIALINKDFHDNIDISTSISAPQEIAFTIHRKHRKLTHAINKFIQTSRSSQELYALYEKYFQTSRTIDDTETSIIPNQGQISIYDGLIQKYAQKINWDWRLLASLVEQESAFKPHAKSWAGASGLMQLMPATAKRFGINNLNRIYEPELNIQTGTNYIAWLNNFWKEIKDETERLKFIMASYNAGQGHVKDAQRLAKKYGYNPLVWDGHVEYFLLNKSKPFFYRDPVCKHGYCRGSEPFHYVRNIIKKYAQYKKLFTEDHNMSYDFSLNFAPAYDFELGYEEDDRIALKKRPLFNQSKEIFKENPLIKKDSNGYNNLKPKNPERIRLKDNVAPTNQLFRKNELFKKNTQ